MMPLGQNNSVGRLSRAAFRLGQFRDCPAFGMLLNSMVALGLASAVGTGARAQGIEPDIFVETFREACAAVVRAPSAETVQELVDSNDGAVVETHDGFATLGIVQFEKFRSAEVAIVHLNTTVQSFAQGRQIACGLTAVGTRPVDVVALEGLLGSLATDIVGEPHEKHGGPTRSAIRSGGVFLVYATPGFPPTRVLRLEDHGRSVTLSLTQFVAE